MRLTVLNKGWMYNKAGDLCGINLGSDFCAEHEEGIGLIQAAFGINGVVKKQVTKLMGIPIRTKSVMTPGIDARTIDKVPDTFVYGLDDFKYFGYYDTTFSKWTQTLLKDAIGILQSDPTGSIDFIAYWCDRGFFVVSEDKEMIAMQDAFMNKDIAIFMGERHFISNRGLVLAIKSKLDADVIDKMMESDEDMIELNRQALLTGIKEKLDKAGKRYYALSPRWRGDYKLEVCFWLNPYDQHKYNYGMYSVDELLQWIDEKGPVIRK